MCKEPIVIDVDNNLYDENNVDTNNKTEEYVHTVLIEEASDTGCIPCVTVAKILHELYETKEYNFYYVSLVDDKSNVAQKRLKEELNVFGHPVVYIDGGHKVYFAANTPKEEYIKSIINAQERSKPNITLNVTAEYDENSTELITTVFASNKESENYTGTIRIYLTEIISRWNQANSEPYHFALVDFIINKYIDIPAKGNITIQDKRDLSEFEVSDLKPEELFVVGVIFNSKSVKRDSFPIDDTKGEFDAHFADATTATYVVPGGNLPPQASIIHPEVGKFHAYNKAIFDAPLKKTILTGNTQIVAKAKDDTNVEKVEFYIDGNIVCTDEEAPYQYELKKPKLFGRLTLSPTHQIKIIAYDSEGKTDDAVLDVITLFRIDN